MTRGIALRLLLGGAAGSLLRALVSLADPHGGAAALHAALPWATIAINVTGSFAIGCFGTLTLAQGRHPVSEPTRLLVMVGLCGGYTTFSAFSLQTLVLVQRHAAGLALLNVALSLALGLLAIAAGHGLAAALNGGRRAVVQDAREQAE